MKLLRLTEPRNSAKKWRAEFSDGKGVEFGQANAPDYTLSKGTAEDKAQRERYRARHMKDLDTDDPRRAGFLAMEILWGNSTDIARNIASYKRKYNL
jgi:hypothetical protein